MYTQTNHVCDFITLNYTSITRLQLHLNYTVTVTNGSAAFDALQAPIPHITVYYIYIHKLITFVTLLHLITSQ